MYRFALLLLIAPTPGIAGDPLECVDPVFVGAFLSGTNSTPISYSTEMPENFEVRRVPPGMELVGSQNEGSSTTVIYHADQDRRDAYAALAEILSGQGWEDITYDRVPSRRGFQSAGQWLVAEYCRDNDDTNLSVVVSEREGQTLVSVTRYERKTLRGCLALARDRRRNLIDRLPVMNPPDGAITSNSVRANSGRAVSTGIDVSASMGRDDLHEFFEDQVRDEEWTFVTRWSSDLSTGSVWTQGTAELGLLIATLHLYDAGGEPVRVQFSIDTAEPARDIDHGMSAQYSGPCDSRDD